MSRIITIECQNYDCNYMWEKQQIEVWNDWFENEYPFCPNCASENVLIVKK